MSRARHLDGAQASGAGGTRPGWAAADPTDSWATPAQRTQDAAGKQASSVGETPDRGLGGRGAVAAGELACPAPYLLRLLDAQKKKEAGDYNKSTEGADWEEPASPSSAWPVDPLSGRGMRGGGRAPGVERSQLTPRMAVYSSITVSDEHPGR